MIDIQPAQRRKLAREIFALQLKHPLLFAEVEKLTEGIRQESKRTASPDNSSDVLDKLIKSLEDANAE